MLMGEQLSVELAMVEKSNIGKSVSPFSYFSM
jgi:hypothetical protein